MKKLLIAVLSLSLLTCSMQSECSMSLVSKVKNYALSRENLKKGLLGGALIGVFVGGLYYSYTKWPHRGWMQGEAESPPPSRGIKNDILDGLYSLFQLLDCLFKGVNTEKYRSDNFHNKSCPVCLEEYNLYSRVIKKLQCGHGLCEGCFSLLQRPKCPNCRESIEELSNQT